MFTVLILALASPPEFVVVNKTAPNFTVVNLTPARVVPATPTFRTVQHHEGHSCPSCGRQQFVIYSGGKYGPHSHRCSYDGTVWQHGG